MAHDDGGVSLSPCLSAAGIEGALRLPRGLCARLFAHDEGRKPDLGRISESRADADRAAKSYGRNAERLIKAKRHYDPDNFFSAIPPPGRHNMAAE